MITGVNDTGEQFTADIDTRVKNESQIFIWILEEIRNRATGIIRGLEKLIRKKTWSQKSHDCPFK